MTVRERERRAAAAVRRGMRRPAAVAAADCADANAPATAALVKGVGVERWLRGLGLPARLVARDGTVVTTPGRQVRFSWKGLGPRGRGPLGRWSRAAAPATTPTARSASSARP